MEQSCKYEKDIVQLMTIVSKIDKDINGNGKKGLRDTVTELNVTMQEHNVIFKDLKTAISGFNKFEIETKAIEKQKEKKTVTLIAVIGLVFTGITILINILL